MIMATSAHGKHKKASYKNEVSLAHHRDKEPFIWSFCPVCMPNEYALYTAKHRKMVFHL